MTGLSRVCQLVWACRPVRNCFVVCVCVHEFPPSRGLVGMADAAAWLCCSGLGAVDVFTGVC